MRFGLQEKDHDPMVLRKGSKKRREKSFGGNKMKKGMYVREEKVKKGNRSHEHKAMHFMAPAYLFKREKAEGCMREGEESITFNYGRDYKEKTPLEDVVEVIDFVAEYDTLLVGCRYALASALSEAELRMTYKEELKPYEPFIYLTEEMGKAFRDYPCRW